MSCCVPDFVGDEIFIKREAILADDAREHRRSFFRSAQCNIFAAFDQHGVSEVLVNRTARLANRQLYENANPPLPPLPSLPKPSADALRKIFCV